MKADDGTSHVSAHASTDNANQFYLGASAPTPAPAADTENDVRCSCGALLARWVSAGLELKCRRCKCTTLIPYPKRTSFTRARPA